MKCTKIFISRKTHFYVQVTMYATKMFSRATEICFLTCLTLLMMFKSSDFKGNSFRVISGNPTGKMCPFLIFLEIHFGTWSPFVFYNTYIGVHICIIKDKILVPQRGRYHWAPPNSLLPGQAYGGLAVKATWLIVCRQRAFTGFFLLSLVEFAR